MWGSEWGIYSWDVCMYVRLYVSVNLSNVNLRSCLECQFALNAQELRHHWYVNYMRTSGQRFLAMQDEEDSTAGLCNVLIWQSQVQKWVLNAADESKKGTRKSSKVESTYWRVFTSQVLVHATVVCTVLWASTKPATHNFWHLLRLPHLHVQCA